jgi:hypothetical protein
MLTVGICHVNGKMTLDTRIVDMAMRIMKENKQKFDALLGRLINAEPPKRSETRADLGPDAETSHHQRDLGTKRSPQTGHSIRSKSMRRISAGEISPPHFGQTASSEALTFSRLIFRALGIDLPF